MPRHEHNTNISGFDPSLPNVVGEGPVLGGAVIFTQPADRAPDSGFGQRWAVCLAPPTPTPVPPPTVSLPRRCT